MSGVSLHGDAALTLDSCTGRVYVLFPSHVLRIPPAAADDDETTLPQIASGAHNDR